MANYGQMRKAMVGGQLRPDGVTDWQILSVMARVPREIFLPEIYRPLAYVDEALPVSPSRMMPAPAALGQLLQLAEVGAEEAVLDLACGTGYSSAVLAGLSGTVVAIEDDAALVEAANANLASLGLNNATALEGELTAGCPGRAPFDVIVIQGSVDEVPTALLDQLREGGRLVASIGRGKAAIAYRYLRTGDAVARTAHFNLNLPPLTTFIRTETFSF